MDSTAGPGEDYRCTRCGRLTEPVKVSSGGRIGWFCHGCDLFRPGEGVETPEAPLDG